MKLIRHPAAKDLDLFFASGIILFLSHCGFYFDYG